MGPRIGNVFSSTVSSLPQSAGERGASGGIAPAAPQDSRAAVEAPAPQGFGGGGAAADQSAVAGDKLAALPTLVANNAANQQGQPINRLILRNGTISVSVENTISAEKGIEGMISQMAGDGAFIVSTSETPSGSDNSPYVNMVIRLPAAHFDEAMDAIGRMAAKGTTPTLTKTADDVTDQYVDVKARLTSMEAARDRLQQIMSTAQNTNDLLQAESLLTQREADIEALKGRMQFLEQSAALSSITITLQPYVLSQPVDTSWHPAETLREAVNALLNSLRGFGDFLIIFIVSVLPWLLLLALFFYGVYRLIRGLTRRMRAGRAASGSDKS
jgi:hypothetical protein